MAHCPHCRCESLFVEARVAHHKHLIFTVLSAGLWLIPWAALVLGKLLRPYRCQICGWHKPEFRKIMRSASGRLYDPALGAKKMQPPTVE